MTRPHEETWRAIGAPLQKKDFIVDDSDEALKARCAAALVGIGQAVDLTHPDYCPTCDGACVCESDLR
jgi:hypothetical protein